MSAFGPQRGALSRLVVAGSARGIGLAYLALSMLMGIVGGGLAMLMRAQLSAEHGQEILLPETYLSVVSMHGAVMVFGVAMPALFAGIGALALPGLLGRRRFLWHGLHVTSFWLMLLAQLVLLGSFALEAGAARSGWTSLPPLSAFEVRPWDGQDLWLLGMGLVCVAFLLICLVYARSSAGLAFGRSFFAQAYGLAAWIGIFSFPMMLLGLCLLSADRHWGTSFFMPGEMVLNDRVLDYAGGLPFLFRSLFWQLGHPNMLILSLPALAIAHSIVASAVCAAGGEMHGERSSLWSIRVMVLAAALFWMQRLFAALSTPYVPEEASPLAFVAVACLLSVGLNLALSLARPGLRLGLALHFVVAMLVTLVAACLGGLWLAAQVTSERLHGSYFALGHLHLLLGLLSLLAIFAAIYHGFERWCGRALDQDLGRLHFWLTFVALFGVFVLMQFQGFSGLLRGYWEHSHYDFAATGQQLTPIISGLSYLGAGAQVLFLINLASSLMFGEPCEPDAEARSD